VITIGIDPHKRSLTAVALDAHSQPLGSLRVAMTDRAVVRLLAWAVPWPARRWAVEGATGLGHTVAQQLVGAGELVVDVPAKLAARARLLGAGSARKTDRTDAASVAAVALHHRRLRQVAAEDHTRALRLLSDRRDDLVADRTRTLKPAPRSALCPASGRRRAEPDRPAGRGAARPAPPGRRCRL
jgi:hypothetical protein